MVQAKHCDLCEFPKRDFKNGLRCGLTNKKPDFKRFCPNIKFTRSFKQYIPELLNEIIQVKKNRVYVYFYFVFMSVFGTLILFKSYSLLKEVLDLDFNHSSFHYFEIAFIVFILGALFILFACRNLYKHISLLNQLRAEKEKLETVLGNYDLDFYTKENK